MKTFTKSIPPLEGLFEHIPLSNAWQFMDGAGKGPGQSRARWNTDSAGVRARRTGKQIRTGEEGSWYTSADDAFATLPIKAVGTGVPS